MITIFALTLLAASSPTAVEMRQARLERARKGMAYMHCLYGTRYPDETIVGLPQKKKDRPAFLKSRVEECATTRVISESALIESLSETDETSPQEEEAQVSRQLAAVDRGFRKAVLDPAQLERETRNFMRCMKTKGAAKC